MSARKPVYYNEDLEKAMKKIDDSRQAFSLTNEEMKNMMVKNLPGYVRSNSNAVDGSIYYPVDDTTKPEPSVFRKN